MMITLNESIGITFEYTLAFHCAPTLAKEKTANLMSLNHIKFKAVKDIITVYNHHFSSEGLAMKILCECSQRTLVFIYHKELLMDYLYIPEIKTYLETAGYDLDIMDLEAILVRLSKRMMKHQQLKKEYPHEIGLFLNYPLEDVTGFIKNSGQNYMLCGYWKVYANLENTKQRFRRYDSLRHHLCEQIKNGHRVLDNMKQELFVCVEF
ncbi:MAG: DUF3793 domain-containing protein [Firmicutes bacterium HGW-Firmicutes-7]|nr:MAG: DUF3793 domain-containing protein [Firmicutes bacterium HGW-Firmicutes-7]